MIKLQILPGSVEKCDLASLHGAMPRFASVQQSCSGRRAAVLLLCLLFVFTPPCVVRGSSVSFLAHQDYVLNEFDPANYTGARDAIELARSPVNTVSTSTKWFVQSRSRL